MYLNFDSHCKSFPTHNTYYHITDYIVHCLFFVYLFRNLRDRDVFSKSDPVCILFTKNFKSETFYEVSFFVSFSTQAYTIFPWHFVHSSLQTHLLCSVVRSTKQSSFNWSVCDWELNRHVLNVMGNQCDCAMWLYLLNYNSSGWLPYSFRLLNFTHKCPYVDIEDDTCPVRHATASQPRSYDSHTHCGGVCGSVGAFVCVYINVHITVYMCAWIYRCTYFITLICRDARYVELALEIDAPL